MLRPRSWETTLTPRNWDVSFFADANATNPLKLADLGEVWAGDEGRLVIFFRNDEAGEVRDIVYSSKNLAVSFIGPKSLEVAEIGSITIIWAPDIIIEEGLQDILRIEGTLVL